ncbi:methylation-associated defense system restriction endonuclease subunit S MAD5 [Elizabethkingia miricola]|uniref:methylation-associated defense system restriction endonuclease subunit S MAD5 n=1 Tax=Elizabethkingia miricola TaxID=172045 RepID=UPI0007416739|nr:restriction endonuclease subunit S [Elizabethkingia miricola]KUG12501.1 hypothetical protein AMC91_06390 [Elizabethkingia miricola]
MKFGKIKSGFISNDIRFNAGYFLNEDAINSRVVESNSSKCWQLFELAEVWNPPIFKRQFCSNSERAIPYCQSSDVTNALEGTDIYINKKQAYKVGSIVEKDQILVTGFGTIGNTRLVNELSHGSSFANNVCRIKAKENVPVGYIYAFMTSKYGKSQLNKNASGSVVRYIEAPGIKKTLIPILPEETQQKIHNIIVDAANLRVEANKLLKEAQERIVNELNIKVQKQNYFTKISELKNSHQKRFEAFTFKSVGSDYRKQIEKLPHHKLIDFSERIFRPGIFKRNYVAEGVDFLGGSDITSAIPVSDKKLSKARTSNFDDLTLKEDWILVTCGGTIGTTVLVNDFLSQKLASQHILRVIPKDIPTGYLFAFLNSEIGLKVIQSFMYGSVIQQIEPHHLELVPIPLLSEDLMNSAHENVMRYKNNMNSAINMELEAIDLIEKEIDQWQQL